MFRIIVERVSASMDRNEAWTTLDCGVGRAVMVEAHGRQALALGSGRCGACGA